MEERKKPTFVIGRRTDTRKTLHYSCISMVVHICFFFNEKVSENRRRLADFCGFLKKKKSLLINFDVYLQCHMVKNCQLGTVLSYGSEGTVYSGTLYGKIVAIKVLSNQYARRVEIEMKLVKSLDHTNIIKYYDLEYEQKMAYLVMEFITGGNLYQFIQAKFNSSSYWIMVDKILEDIAQGMIYLHHHRIVQGDLKSHNILLREGINQAVICDFGIARSLDNDNQQGERANTTKGKMV